MTRYFFHVSNSHTFTDEAGKDPIGQQFSDPENAKLTLPVLQGKLLRTMTGMVIR
jgi:hypothetical protein